MFFCALKWIWHIQIYFVIQPKGCTAGIVILSVDNFSRKEIALFYYDSKENKCLTVPPGFLGVFTFFPSTNSALLLLQGYNHPKWWSHSNVFRIHSRDRTPETSVSGKRLENQIRRCCWWAVPRNVWVSDPHGWVTVPQWRTTCLLNTNDWLCMYVCVLAISKSAEKPDSANTDERSLTFFVEAIGVCAFVPCSAADLQQLIDAG